MERAFVLNLPTFKSQVTQTPESFRSSILDENPCWAKATAVKVNDKAQRIATDPTRFCFLLNMRFTSSLNAGSLLETYTNVLLVR
jgi:hypothetical protein